MIALGDTSLCFIMGISILWSPKQNQCRFPGQATCLHQGHWGAKDVLCFFFFRCVVHVWVLVYHQIGLLQNFHTMRRVFFLFSSFCVNVVESASTDIGSYGITWIRVSWSSLPNSRREFATDQLWPVGTERSSHCHRYLTQRGIGIRWVHHPQIFGCESHDMPWFMGERTHSWSLFVWQRCLWLRSEVEICWSHLVSDKYDEDVMQG